MLKKLCTFYHLLLFKSSSVQLKSLTIESWLPFFRRWRGEEEDWTQRGNEMLYHVSERSYITEDVNELLVPDCCSCKTCCIWILHVCNRDDSVIKQVLSPSIRINRSIDEMHITPVFLDFWHTFSTSVLAENCFFCYMLAKDCVCRKRKYKYTNFSLSWRGSKKPYLGEQNDNDLVGCWSTYKSPLSFMVTLN